MQTKLWQKPYTLDEKIEQFTIGKDRELDLQLATYDILGSIAHVKMLAEVKLITFAEMEELHETLIDLYHQAKKGALQIEEGVEDIHSQVELMLTRKLGDSGKKLHTGRSRNDQVLVDLRLFFRAALEQVVQLTEALFHTLQKLSDTHSEVLLPGYTHLQEAMVSSFGLWFGAYAETLCDDLRQLLATFQIINQNPLGSAAGYGTSLPLNRQFTTDLLGFASLNYNVVHAQMGRGKTELSLSFALAGLAHTINKLATDICWYSNQGFAFLKLPDAFTTGSSIMPHKKNPDVFELIRARSNQLQSVPATIMALTSNLPSGYHRDFQLLKEPIFPALEQMKSCLEMMNYGLAHLEVRQDILKDKRYQLLFTVEAVNDRVKAGVPFRQAYHEVGELVESGAFHYDQMPNHSHEGSLGNLCNQAILEKFQAIRSAFPFQHIETALQALLREEVDDG